MARSIRIAYPGAVYQVMARGNQGRPIFADDPDRRCWLETLAEACTKTGWRVHAYALMGNHYHRLLETPQRNLVAGMKWLQATHTPLLGLSREALESLPKGAPEKVALAWWMRERTTVSLRWVGERLVMGHYSRVTQAVSRMRRHPGRRLAKFRRRLEDVSNKASNE